jgi:hypothetical protein
MRFLNLFVVVSTFFGFMPAIAVPVPVGPDIVPLTSKADFIAVGKVESVEVTEQPTEDQNQIENVVARITVHREIKGDLGTNEIDVALTVSKAFDGRRGLSTNQFGIFFLQGASGAEFIPADPFYFVVAASPLAPKLTGKETSLERVLAELLQVLIYQKQTVDLAKLAYRNLTPSLESALNSQIIDEAIEGLKAVPSLKATEHLRRAVQEGSDRTRLLAAAALLPRNDLSYLTLIKSALLDPPSKVESNVLLHLSQSLEMTRDIKAIPIFVELLDSQNVEVRRSVTNALRRMGSSAIDALTLSLEDKDSIVRYNAVIGLSEITNQGNQGPAIDTFLNDEQLYLNYWKNWVHSKFRRTQ